MHVGETGVCALFLPQRLERLLKEAIAVLLARHMYSNGAAGSASRGTRPPGGRYNNNIHTYIYSETPILDADPMPTLGPTAASAADADRAALHTTASGVPNEHVSRLRQ